MNMDAIALAKKLLPILREELRTYLSGEHLENVCAGNGDSRVLARSTLDTMDAVEAYLALRPVLEVGSDQPEPAVSTAPAPDPRLEEGEIEGIFYRWPHGGEIVSKEAKYRIPESTVRAVGVEHEAQIAFKMKSAYSVTAIRILEQGDDSLAPIRKFLGYVTLRSGQWHAAESLEFGPFHMIHELDAEKNHLDEGQPAIFNIGDGHSIARISKLYPVNSVPPASVPQPKARSAKRADRERETFLEGITVVVLGGESKWFEEAVRDTGADFVHLNGRENVNADKVVRKADVVCMLITSTSHQAYWDVKDGAKEQGIPLINIEGSKSSLVNSLKERMTEIKAAHERRRA